MLQGSQAKADQLLLEVYSSINEPDGIYAVARGHSMMSQLKLYEHEGSWDKALAGYDMLCHRKASQHGQAVSSPSPPYTAAQDRAGASVSGQQGLLTSLQQLGCRHLIEAYWQSQPGSLSEGWLLPNQNWLAHLMCTSQTQVKTLCMRLREAFPLYTKPVCYMKLQQRDMLF